MVSIHVKIGPKGQIVIPKVIRDEYKMNPGTIITLKERQGELLVIREQKVDPIKTFENIAKRMKTKSFDKHSVEKEAEERWNRTK